MTQQLDFSSGLALDVEAEVHLLRVDAERTRLEHGELLEVVEAAHVDVVLEELDEVEPVAKDALLVVQLALLARVHDGLRGDPCAVGRERALHLLPLHAREGVLLSEHGLHALLRERENRLEVLRIKMVLERKNLVSLLRDERHVLRRKEESVNNRLDRRESRVRVGRGIARDRDIRRASLLLPVGKRVLVLFGRRERGEVGLLGRNVSERLLLGLAGGEEGIEVDVLRLKEVYRRENFGRADASVMVGIHQLKHAKVEPDASRRHRKRNPLLAVEFREGGDIGTARKRNLLHSSGPEPFPAVAHFNSP